jgi:hypothetical protein
VNPSNRVKITAYLVTGAWSVALLIAGVQLSGTINKVLGSLPILIVGLFAIFDTWLWHVGPIKHLVKRPGLNGTWKGALTSLRADGNGQEVPHAPILVFLVIKQSYLNLNITLLSQESNSRSIATLVQVNPEGNFTVYYHYTNTPGLAVRDRSPIHSGGARIEVTDVAPRSLEGEYWTDRRTRGTFTMKRASKKRYGTYAEAVAKMSEGDN